MYTASVSVKERLELGVFFDIPNMLSRHRFIIIQIKKVFCSRICWSWTYQRGLVSHGFCRTEHELTPKYRFWSVPLVKSLRQPFLSIVASSFHVHIRVFDSQQSWKALPQALPPCLQVINQTILQKPPDLLQTVPIILRRSIYPPSQSRL